MHVKEYEVFARDAVVSDYTRIGYIGEPMILHGKTYDPDQAWLPFMQGVILKYAPSEYYVPMERSSSRKWVQTLAERPIRIPTGWEKMYDYSCVEQMLLPFREYQRVAGSEFESAKRSWQRMSPDTRQRMANGSSRIIHYSLFSISLMDIKNLTPAQLDTWCRDHLGGRYAFESNTVFFEYEVDWLFAKLRFRGEMKIEEAA